MSKFISFILLVGILAILGGSDVAKAQTNNLIDVYTDNVFNYGVLNNRKPVVVWFGGNTKCTHCKWIYPQLERLAKTRADQLYLAKVDTDKLTELADDYAIEQEPTVMTLYNGEIAEVVEGPQWGKIVALVNSASRMQ